MIIRCIVAGENANGEPDLFFTKIETDEPNFNRGWHYEIAEMAAINEGYGEPFVVFDENDSAGNALCGLMQNWDDVPVFNPEGDE